MKCLVFSAIIAIASLAASAQSNEKVKWKYFVKKFNDKYYEIHMTATIADGWYLYAQNPKGVLIPTKFTFTNNPLVVLDGMPREAGRLLNNRGKFVGPHYEKLVSFIQKVRLVGNSATTINGNVTYTAACDTLRLPTAKEVFSVKVGR
jgi:hypothetical protein